MSRNRQFAVTFLSSPGIGCCGMAAFLSNLAKPSRLLAARALADKVRRIHLPVVFEPHGREARVCGHRASAFGVQRGPPAAPVLLRLRRPKHERATEEFTTRRQIFDTWCDGKEESSGGLRVGGCVVLICRISARLLSPPPPIHFQKGEDK